MGVSPSFAGYFDSSEEYLKKRRDGNGFKTSESQPIFPPCHRRRFVLHRRQDNLSEMSLLALSSSWVGVSEGGRQECSPIY